MVLEVNGTVSRWREFRPPGSSFSSPTSPPWPSRSWLGLASKI